LRTADLFVGFLDDRKVQRAIRAAGSDAVVAYLAVVLASWRDERPAAFADELPLYLEDRADELLAVLVRIGLLEADGTIPTDVWDRRLARAIADAERKRERDRLAGAAGGRSNGERPSDDRQTTARRSPSGRKVPSRSVPVPTPNGVRNGEDVTREDDDPLGPFPGPRTAQEAPRRAKGPDTQPAPVSAVLGRPGPPCRTSAELFRRHQSEHVIRGAELVVCGACDRELSDARPFRERLSAVAASP
jgi:hypothetical protein